MSRRRVPPVVAPDHPRWVMAPAVADWVGGVDLAGAAPSWARAADMYRLGREAWALGVGFKAADMQSLFALCADALPFPAEAIDDDRPPASILAAIAERESVFARWDAP